MNSPEALFRDVVAETGDRITAIRAIRERFGVTRRQAQDVMCQVEGTAAGVHPWPDHEYVPYLEAEQRLYAWILAAVGGIDTPEAIRRAAARFPYEPDNKRGIITHFGAWVIAMGDLFGRRRQPEEFGLAAEYEAKQRQLFDEDE